MRELEVVRFASLGEDFQLHVTTVRTNTGRNMTGESDEDANVMARIIEVVRKSAS